MAFGAVRGSSVCVVLSLGVLACGHDFEVCWVAAGAVAAEVIELHPVWDWLVVVVFPQDPVDNSVAVAGADLVFAVAVGSLGALPDPAVINVLDLTLDAGVLAGCESPWLVHDCIVQ